MAYGLGLKTLNRLCLEQSPLAWQKSKLTAELFKAQEQPCFLWVANHLKQHHALPNIETLHSAFPDTASVETPEPVSYYVKLLENQYFLKIISDANVESQNILNGDHNAHEKAVAILNNALNLVMQQKYRTRIIDVGAEAGTIVFDAYHSSGIENGTSVFGWPYLDQQFGGGRPGDVISFVGRPAAGKTWLNVWTGIINWKKGNNVLFVSMEMQPLPIIQRITSIYTHCNISQLMTSGYGKQTYEKWAARLKGLKEEMALFYVVDGNLASSVEDIYILADQHACKTIVIDGAYLVRHKNPKLDRFNRVAENVELMKRHTTSLDACTFASWQLNREASKKSKSGKAGVTVDDIGYSDAIGQISSIVLGMFQDDGVETLPKRDIRLLKGRNGEIGQFSVAWDFKVMDFSQVLPLLEDQKKASEQYQWM